MGNIAILLGELRTGNAQVRPELFTQVYDELTRLARIRLPRETADQAYVSLKAGLDATWGIRRSV